MDETEAYDSDFYKWALYNADLIRQGRVNDVDFEHVAEELEGLAGRDRRELLSRLELLVMHLLKWRFEPNYRSKSWKRTAHLQRSAIEGLLEQSPSLRSVLNEGALKKAYKRAVKLALLETEIELSALPVECPFEIGQILDFDFWPDGS
jgi:Domain of unknown function DUF29.